MINNQLEVIDMKPEIDHPRYYKGSKFEAIDVIDDYNLGFDLGNAIKYILRAGRKGDFDDMLTDLKKATWYVNRYIDKLGELKKGLDAINGK